MEALPDEALAVSTLRRYATLLGLDEDDLSTRFSRQRPGLRRPDGHPGHPGRDQRGGRRHHRPGPPARLHRDGRGPPGRRADDLGIGHLGELRATRSRQAHRRARSPSSPGPNCARAGARWHGPAAACKRPAGSRSCTWIVGSWSWWSPSDRYCWPRVPRSWRNAHILRVVPAGSAPPTGGGGSSSTPTTAPAHRQVFPVQPAGTTPSSASYTVATSHVRRGGGHLRALLGAGDQLLVGRAAGQRRAAGRKVADLSGRGDDDRRGRLVGRAGRRHHQGQERLHRTSPRRCRSPTRSPAA